MTINRARTGEFAGLFRGVSRGDEVAGHRPLEAKVLRQIRHIGAKIGIVSQKSFLSYYKKGFLHFSSGRLVRVFSGVGRRSGGPGSGPVADDHKNRERNGP
jgi:hypothetical protein